MSNKFLRVAAVAVAIGLTVFGGPLGLGTLTILGATIGTGTLLAVGVSVADGALLENRRRAPRRPT